MQGDVVGFELAVGVEQQASQVVSNLWLPALEGSKEETSGVIVVGVQVVPDQRRALEDWLHLDQAVYREFPGDDFTAWEDWREMLSGSPEVWEGLFHSSKEELKPD